MIQTTSAYHIKVRGEVDESTFNTKSPLQVMAIQVNPDSTSFTIYTDQSGLIGLLRHLHGQGFVLLSVHRHMDEIMFNKEDLTNA
jgi:hypothetical protein